MSHAFHPSVLPSFLPSFLPPSPPSVSLSLSHTHTCTHTQRNDKFRLMSTSTTGKDKEVKNLVGATLSKNFLKQSLLKEESKVCLGQKLCTGKGPGEGGSRSILRIKWGPVKREMGKQEKDGNWRQNMKPCIWTATDEQSCTEWTKF